MAKERPHGFVEYTTVLEVLERSIESSIDFSELTNNAFYDPEERIEHLQELMNLVIELRWRYNGKVLFKFSQKKNFEKDVLPISELTGIHEEEYKEWADRVHVKETTSEKGVSSVYIRF